MASLDNQKLGAVFQSRPDILDKIKRTADSPCRIALFNDIAEFVYDQINASEPAAKRRRIDDGSSNGVANAKGGATKASGKPQSIAAESASAEEILLEVKEISVSAPQRKKFDLCFTRTYLYARAPGTKEPAQGICYTWQDIEFAFRVPVPEKTQAQHNYILFPRGTCLPSKADTAAPATVTAAEPLVFTIPAAPVKQGTIFGREAAQAQSVADLYHTLFDWAFAARFSAASNPISIVVADPAKFHSSVRQASRPNEKAVHVKAFRGTKDGYLFFLPIGVLWGFKKPLLFMPLERIAAISYTSVLQRTFNMVIEVFAGDANSTEEIEFGMLDQADYENIDGNYVRQNRLQDGSLREQRKAKIELAENLKRGNGPVGEGANGAAGSAAVSATELEKAQAEAEQQLQDDEDEDEEDYDPGSEGESEGEGSSSEEEDDDDEEGGEEYDEDEGEDEEDDGTNL